MEESTAAKRGRTILHWFLAVLIGLLIILLFIAVRQKATPVSDTINYKAQRDSLLNQYTALQAQFDKDQASKIRFRAKIDSLEARPPKIIKEYLHAEKRIDNMPVMALIAESDSIFAANGINK